MMFELSDYLLVMQWYEEFEEVFIVYLDLCLNDVLILIVLVWNYVGVGNFEQVEEIFLQLMGMSEESDLEMIE